MSTLWTRLQVILEGYLQLFRNSPDTPLTADTELYSRLLAFARAAEEENHPAAGEVMYLAGGNYITLRPLEAMRVLIQLKQRRTARELGKSLVDEVEFALRPRTYPLRDVHRTKLIGVTRAVADLGGFDTYSGFQVRAWECIQQAIADADTVLLTAPTGAGKTEAFMLPLVQSARTGRHFLIVYPRRELIKDQVGRLLRMVSVANTNAAQQERLIIGVQLGGIQHTLQDALWNDDDPLLRVRCTDCGQYLRKVRTSGWACGCANKRLPPFYWSSPSWTFDSTRKSWSMQKGIIGQRHAYLNLLSSLVVEWPDVLTCPHCNDGSPLRSTVEEFLVADGGGRGAGETTGPVQFRCPTCEFEALMSLSKEHHLRVRPHFLVTNVESLDKLLLDPRYEEAAYFRSIDAVALDEVHVYHTLYGAHVHHLLRRLEKHKEKRCSLIGCSATIPQPADFGERLFGRSIRHLIEANSEEFEQESLSAEYFLFLKVPETDQVAALSTMLQSCMVLGHAILPSDTKPTSGSQVMVFSDSLDVIIRAEHQLNDAEDGRLYNLRMQDQIGGAYPCEGLHRDRCPTLADGSLCPTYLKGECWRLFWDGDLRYDPLSVTSVHAQLKNGMQAAREADVIISSPSLEVGVDLPTVGSTVHYKTPRAVFSFIQRKGRAGRRPGQFPFTIAVLAGNDPMDAFHFQQFARLVSGKYQLPLNPENPIIEAIHHQHLDGTFSNAVMETYTELVNSPEHKRFPQNALRPTGWSVVRDQATCPRWQDEVRLSLPPGLERGNALEFAVKSMDQLIGQKREEIHDKAGKFGRQIEDRSAFTQRLEQGLAELNARVPEPLREATSFAHQWSQALTHVHRLTQLVTESQSLDAVKEDFLDNLLELDSLLSKIKMWLARQNQTSAAREVLIKLQFEANELVDAIQDHGLMEAADRVSDLRYQIAALEKLHLAAKNKLKLPTEIVRRYQQAQFYLCWSCKHWQTCALPQKMSYFIPETYFDNPANLIVDHVGGGTFEEAGYMLYSTYVPWKIFYRFGTDPITVRTSSVPVGRAPDGTPRTEVSLEGLEGIWDVFDGQPYFLPRKIQTVKVQAEEMPQAGNRYRICPGCYNLALGGESRCPSCNSPTLQASVYSAPIVARRFVNRKQIKAFKRLALCHIDGLTQITGADVSYRAQQMADPYLFRAEYTQPLGYRYETRGVVLSLSEALHEAWDAFVSPVAAKSLHVRRAAEEARYSWNKSEPDRDLFEQTLLHSAAHMMIKTISGMCGVNEESLEYAWNTAGQVAVWEKYTGGAGISDLFMSYLETQATEVYTELQRSTTCNHCNMEGQDGCPDSIWISYCQAGRRDQPHAVSRSLGSLLLAVLTHRVPVRDGLKREELAHHGLLVALEKDEQVAVCLDI